LTLRVRIPYWATDGASFKFNGKPLQTAAMSASYVDIRRTWQSGDRWEIEMPIPLQAAICSILEVPVSSGHATHEMKE
jgi:uncharacterized protein